MTSKSFRVEPGRSARRCPNRVTQILNDTEK